MAQGFMAYIQPIDQGAHPDQGLPGRPGGGWNRPDHELPGFPGAPGHPGHLPARPQRPTDPNYGIDEGQHPDAGQLPVWPLDPERPDVGLPPVPGHPLPPTDPPPGTIWPPIPPEFNIPEGKAVVLVAITGLGYRYMVVDIPPGSPDQGLPGEGEDGGETPEHPEVQPPRPGFPARPGQGLPGQPGRPPVAGQPLPRPPGAPARPGQGLPQPPRPQPKR